MFPRLAIFGGFHYMVSISMKSWWFDVFCGSCIFVHLRLQTSFLWRWKMAVFCMIYVLRICRFMAKEPPKMFKLQHIFLPFCQIVNTQNPTVHHGAWQWKGSEVAWAHQLTSNHECHKPKALIYLESTTLVASSPNVVIQFSACHIFDILCSHIIFSSLWYASFLMIWKSL